jgi:uncharacterized protein (TIGR03437 family)
MKRILPCLFAVSCLAQQGTPPAPAVAMGIDLNGEASFTNFSGWPLIVTASAVLWEGNATTLSTVSGGWTSALRLTVKNAQNQDQAWPLRLVPPASDALALTNVSSGEAIWILAAADTAGIPAGTYRISVTLDTSGSAAAGAWKGVASSRTASVTFSAEPASPDQAQQLRKYLAFADAAALNGDSAGAMQNLDRALALKADHIPALDRKGGLLVQAGKLAEAQQAFESALYAFNQQFPRSTEPPVELERKLALVEDTLGNASGPVTLTSINEVGGGPDVAQNTWIEIKGTNLAPADLGPAGFTWSAAPEFASGKMPTQLQGVSVKVNGKPAYVYYISPTQVNVLTPLDGTQGSVAVQLTNGASTGAPFTVKVKNAAPAFLLFGATRYIAATHVDGSLLGPTSMSVPGYAFTPAQPNETIILYANGFGLPSATLVEGSASQFGALPALPVIQVGDTTATVTFAGVVSPGLFQFNLVVPANAASGDNPVTAGYAGFTTPAGALIMVKR